MTRAAEVQGQNSRMSEESERVKKVK